MLCGNAYKTDMSWYNPTPDEAEEAYAYYKRQYSDAASARNASIRQEQNYVSQRNSAKTQIGNLSSQKINFEKRLAGIEKIIKMLEGSGGWFSENVPGEINKANKSIKKADSSYRGSIKMTGAPAASLENAFNVKSVEADPNSASALRDFKNEKSRLEQSLSDIKNQLNSLSSLVSTLNSKIFACNAEQFSLRNTMNTSAYEMNHYKRYMY